MDQIPAMQETRQCLIIDDDPDDQEIFLICLDQLNSNVHCTANSDSVDAITKLDANLAYTPDYIFVDMNMPKMNGIECLKKLRSIARLNNTQIYMYSTTADGRAVEESKLYGANDFIIKPVRTADLKEKLSAIFAVIP
jgi:CheY-like chemotaxis protein